MAVSSRRAGQRGSTLVCAKTDWPRAVGGGFIFRRNAFSGAGFSERVSDALLVCGGSFSVSGRDRNDRAGHGRDDDGAGMLEDQQAISEASTLRVAITDARHPDLAAMPDVCQY